MNARREIKEVRTDDGISWHTLAEYAPLMAEFSVDKAEQNGLVIKNSPARSVLFISLGSQPCVLKIFKAPTIWDRLRVRLFSSRAKLEWRYLFQLRQIEIPVANPIALGTLGATSYLILERILNVKTLKEAVFEAAAPLSFAYRRDLSHSLALLIARLHNNRIVHRDLHFGNVVCDGDGRVHLLDLHDLCAMPLMEKRHCLKNLAMFGSSFTMCATSTDYLRFFKTYRAHSLLLRTYPWSECVKWARDHLRKYCLRFWNERAKRCLANNRHFQKMRLPQGEGVHSRQNDTALRVFCDLDRILAQAEFLKTSRTTLVARTPYGILKVYRRKKMRNFILDCFRPSRAKRSWIAGYQCFIRGIPTAIPLGFLEKRVARFLVSNFLLVEEIPHAQTAWEYLQKFGRHPRGADFVEKKNFLRQMGRLVRIMHIRGVSHRDLKCNNLLLGEGKIYLVDMDGIRIPWWVTRRRRYKDIRRMVRALKALPQITRTDILSLLESYLPYADGEERTWWMRRLR